MIIPDEFVGRICKTRLGIASNNFRNFDQIKKEWPGSEIDVIYESLRPIISVVFKSTEDCLAFKLKYGDMYE